MTARAAKKALVPATACLDIMNGDQRLGTHVAILRWSAKAGPVGRFFDRRTQALLQPAQQRPSSVAASRRERFWASPPLLGCARSHAIQHAATCSKCWRRPAATFSRPRRWLLIVEVPPLMIWRPLPLGAVRRSLRQLAWRGSLVIASVRCSSRLNQRQCTSSFATGRCATPPRNENLAWFDGHGAVP
jgi:hypothetical protein